MSQARRSHALRALGVMPLRRRGSTAPDEVVASPPMPSTPEAGAGGQPPTVRLRLWFPPGADDPFQGPRASLLRYLIHAVGLEPAQVTFAAADDVDLPVLAFGPGGPVEGVQLPALESLRDPVEKRIAWVRLRRLRSMVLRTLP